MSMPVKIWVSILLLAVGGYGGYLLYKSRSAAEPIRNYGQQPAQLTGFEVGDFTLTERSGKEFHASDMKGQVWVVSFFFGDCAGACVTLNNNIAELLKTDLADVPVRFVSITVDPQKDTPARLREYAGNYTGGQIDPDRWLFLTDPNGDIEPIKAVSSNFKLAFSKLMHSDRMIVIDQDGKVQGYYQSSFPAEVEMLKRKVLELTSKGSVSAKSNTPAAAASSG